MTPLQRNGSAIASVMRVLAACLALAFAIGWGVASAAEPTGDPTRPERLRAAKSWGYQLQHLDVERLSKAPHDVLVIDYSRDGNHLGAFTRVDIDRLKSKPDGRRRIVLAYMSVGEAETYRFYWDWKWGGTWYGWITAWAFAPGWLGPENPEWGGNFAVRYWHPGWQQIVIGDGGYLDRIIAAGFDGIYLDKIDSSIEPIAKGRATALADMRTFVARIAHRGRAKSPGFLVLPQNGEELLDDPAYVALIDGMGKEDLLFGEYKEKAANPPGLIKRRIGMIEPLRRAGKPVLAVEYVDDPATIAKARKRLQDEGYIVHFADRDLARMRFADVSDRPVPPAKEKRRRWPPWRSE